MWMWVWVWVGVGEWVWYVGVGVWMCGKALTADAPKVLPCSILFYSIIK